MFPLLLILFVWRVLPWNLAVHFFALLLLEHLAQEAQRVLITLGRSVQATVLFFVRGGLWVYVVLAVMAQEPAARTVQTAALGWLIGVGVSLVGGAYWLRDQSWDWWRK